MELFIAAISGKKIILKAGIRWSKILRIPIRIPIWDTGVRISSTFSVLRPFSYLRPFLYFDPPTLLRPKLYFDLNDTSTFLSQLYFDLNFTSTFLSQLYFDLFVTSLLRLFCHNFTSTFLSQVYFDFFCHNFTSTFLSQVYFDLFGQTLLRPKLNFSTNKKSSFDKMSKYRGRSKEFKVKRSKYEDMKMVEVQKKSN